jgi:choline monooxygenase
MPSVPTSIDIHPDIAVAWSLPASLYYDPAILSRENDRIFGRTWQVVGHRHQVANPATTSPSIYWENLLY